MLDESYLGLDAPSRYAFYDLVTHFMDEAERLCDRLAVIDAGRVVAVDSPAGLIERVTSEQRVTFRASAEVDDQILTALPDVSGVSRDGGRLVVTGTGNVLYSLVTTLAAHDIVATEVRTDDANLEDAFVALTGRSFDPEPSAA